MNQDFKRKNELHHVRASDPKRKFVPADLLGSPAKHSGNRSIMPNSVSSMDHKKEGIPPTNSLYEVSRILILKLGNSSRRKINNVYLMEISLTEY